MLLCLQAAQPVRLLIFLNKHQNLHQKALIQITCAVAAFKFIMVLMEYGVDKFVDTGRTTGTRRDRGCHARGVDAGT